MLGLKGLRDVLMGKPKMTDREFYLLMRLVVDQDASPRQGEWNFINSLIGKGWVRYLHGRAMYEVTVDGHKAYYARRSEEDHKLENILRVKAMQRSHVTTTVSVPVVHVPTPEPRAFAQEITIRPATRSFRNNVHTMDELEETIEHDQLVRAYALAQACCWI